jgi:hypothetical protein
MSIPTAVSAVAEAVAGWLDPEKREKRVLRGAIESAEQLLMILRKQGNYKHMTDKQRTQREVHHQKRFDAWKDGRT